MPDQAGQALEPSVLIPLQLLGRGGRLVLVGDPQQLPATVLSRAAERAGLGLSLFERLQQAPSLRPLQLLFYLTIEQSDAKPCACTHAARHGCCCPCMEAGSSRLRV